LLTLKLSKTEEFIVGDWFGTNLELSDFERLLKADDLDEEPMPIQKFVTDRHYLGLEFGLSEIQLEIARHTTQVFKPETLLRLEGTEFLEGYTPEEYYKKYTVNEVICQVGKGAGKDHTSRISMAYIGYLMHCLRDPLKYYGKASGVYVDLVNLAVNAKQAQQVFFDPLKNILLRSPWANEVGFEPRVQEIFWFDRPLRMFSGHSEAEGWEGYEVMVVILDEISAFKALPNNALVLTPQGWRKNGDLRRGDLVIGSNGLPTQIVGVFPQGRKEVFEVTFEDGAKVQCSDNHIWNVYEYSDGRRLANKNLQLKDFKSLRLNNGNKQFRYSVPTVAPVQFDSPAELPIHPYLMGILLSEGSLRSPLGFTNGDAFVVKKIAGLTEHSVVPSHKGCKPFEWRINSGGVLEDHLRDLGLWNTTSHTKFIPEVYLRSSVEDRIELLRGLMDGDGTAARGQGSYTTVSDRLKDDFIEICRSLGGIPTASKHDSWYKNSSGDKVECSDKWMICPRVPVNPFSLPRKADAWKPHRRQMKRTIVDVQSLGYEDEMTCIKVVNDDGLYVVDNYVVTHNTDVELKGDLRNKGSASVIYEMARASITSRFPDVGKVVLLSFPRFKNDFIQQRYKSVIDDLKEQGVEITEEKWGNKGVERERKTWALKAATWDVNPTRHRHEFDDEFRRDPIMARARYECEPPEMEDAYFRDVESVRSAFMAKPNPVDEEGHYADWFKGTDNHNRFIHIDLGLKRDRAALGMVHCPGLKEIKTGNGVERLPIIEMDFLQSWEAQPYCEIPFAEVRNVIVDLSRRFNVAMVTFDQWQSADMIQSLRSLGINADLHTVKKTDYDTLSTAIYDKRFRGYWNELLVEEELLKLKLINNTKVDHPSTGSKDLADAIAGSTFMCLKELTTDVEIEIEVLQSVDYDELTTESIDMVQRYKGSVKYATDVNKEMPKDIAEWLHGLEMI
jgi:hypothetical protein